MTLYPLSALELRSIRSALPAPVTAVLLENPGSFVAGGFPRDCLADYPPKDIDIFFPSVEAAVKASTAFLNKYPARAPYMSDRADTFHGIEGGTPIQFIRSPNRVGTPEEVLGAFDFLCCQIAVSADNSYAALGAAASAKARELDYTNPPFEVNDPAQSVARALRFVRRGWEFDPDDLATALEAFKRYEAEGRAAVNETVESRCRVGVGGVQGY